MREEKTNIWGQMAEIEEKDPLEMIEEEEDYTNLKIEMLGSSRDKKLWWAEEYD